MHQLALSGYLDITRYPEFRSAFEGVPHEEPVCIDLREATGVDAMFLSELLLFGRRHAGRVAALIAPEGPLVRVFAVLNVSDKLPLFTDPAAAAAHLSAPG